MAADKILMFTQRGLDLELGLPTEGGTFPKMTHMIICMGDVLADEEAVRNMTDWPDAHTTKIALGGVQRYPNNEGAKILAHLPADFVLPANKVITGIGIELSDGSKYTYAPYYQAQGGLLKPQGLALTIDVILSKRNAAALTVQYEPYDSLAMSQIVIERALTELPIASEQQTGLLSSGDYQILANQNNRTVFEGGAQIIEIPLSAIRHRMTFDQVQPETTGALRWKALDADGNDITGYYKNFFGSGSDTLNYGDPLNYQGVVAGQGGINGSVDVMNMPNNQVGFGLDVLAATNHIYGPLQNAPFFSRSPSGVDARTIQFYWSNGVNFTPESKIILEG